MRFLEVSLVGCLYATSRWTLTTTLFKAIERINLSRGSKTCFYTSNEDLVILRIKRRWICSLGSIAIFSRFALLLFSSSFFLKI
jgi:hypothetical protein